MLVRMMTLLLLLMGVHLAACNDILYDNCIVKEEKVEFDTFKNEVSFRMSANPETDVVVKVKEGNKKGTIQHTFPKLKWMMVKLQLRGQPQLITDKSSFKTMENITFTQGTRKSVKIENSYILRGCRQGLPNWELWDVRYKRIPSSGGEESLIILPKTDTKVTMDVDGEKVVLCQDGDTVKLMGEEGKLECGNLKQDQKVRLRLTRGDTDQKIEILDQQTAPFPLKGEGRELKFLRENLTGTLYIVQCLNSCSNYGAEAPATEGALETGSEASTKGGTLKTSVEAPATAGTLETGVLDGWQLWACLVVIACLAIVVVLLGVKIFHIRGQLHRERHQLLTLPKPQEVSAKTGGDRSNQMVIQERVNKHGVVDTLNDIYVPFEELWHE